MLIHFSKMGVVFGNPSPVKMCDSSKAKPGLLTNDLARVTCPNCKAIIEARDRALINRKDVTK